MFSDQMGVNRSFINAFLSKNRKRFWSHFFVKSAPTIAGIFGPFVANVSLFLSEPQPGVNI